MKRIKKEYWILSIAFFIGAILLFYFFENTKLETTLSCVAISIAIIAMGLNDKKLLDFNGEIKIWATYIGGANEESPLYKFSYQIVNKDKEPVHDLIYRIKLPKSITLINEDSNLFSISYSRKTIYLVDDSSGFLGTNPKNNFIANEEIKLRLKDWKENNIYFTISGMNMIPTTFCIYPDMAEKLMNSTSATSKIAIKLY